MNRHITYIKYKLFMKGDYIAADEYLCFASIKFNDGYKYKCRMLGKECPDTALYLFGTVHWYGGIFEDIRIKI